MTDDRAPFREAREHGLRARHETRLARARAVIPEEAVEAAGRVYMAQCGWDWDDLDGAVEDHPVTQSVMRTDIRAALEAALPHLRPHETREVRAIRKAVAEEIAEALEATSDEDWLVLGNVAGTYAAKLAREIGAKE